MGWPELLRALEAEAGREAQALRRRAAEEAARVVGAAREAAAALVETRVARDAAEAAREGAAALAALDEARRRERLLLERALLDEVRQAAAARLVAEAGEPLLARLIGEVLAAAPDGPLRLEVDPGAEAAARAVLEADHPALLARVAVEAASAPRGGVLLRAGPLTLDDTLPARLERAWEVLAPALVRSLLDGGGR